jgi:hypothetical protein
MDAVALTDRYVARWNWNEDNVTSARIDPLCLIGNPMVSMLEG